LSKHFVSVRQVRKPCAIAWIEREGLFQVPNAFIPASLSSCYSGEGY
jgi:hypothetical protein